MDPQYLGEEILTNSLTNFEIKVDDLISADSYDESKLLERYKKYTSDEQILLMKCAMQIAIIGAGNKNYGSIRHNDSVIEIKTIFKKLGVQHDQGSNAKYDPAEFSARRLPRFFRYQIRDFIVRTNRPSYLWLKYSDRDQKYFSLCFPGCEHLITEREEAIYLLKTYIKVDKILNTTFIMRIRRIYIARNLFDPIEFETLLNTLSLKA